MTYHSHEEKLKQLKKLIDRQTTGRPRDFAKKLNVTERTFYRMIDELNLDGYCITYSRKEQRYINQPKPE